VGAPISLSARERLATQRVAVTPPPASARPEAASATAIAAPVDVFEGSKTTSVTDADDLLMARVRGALNHAGTALQKALEENPAAERAGALLQEHVAPVVDAIGAALDKNVKGRVLRNTSFLVGTGLRLNLPGINLNGGVWSTLYTPSLELAKKAGGASNAFFLNYGADVESPVGGLGWGRRGRASAQVNLFFVTASFDEKQSVVFVGIPGIFGITLGSDVERGSYATFQNALPLTPLWFFGPLWTFGFEVYSPLLDPVTKYLVRPVAGAIVKGVQWVGDQLSRGYAAVTSWLRADDVGAPAATAERAA
jgi:hypothetical protein